MRNIKFVKLHRLKLVKVPTGYVFKDPTYYGKVYSAGLLFELDKLYCHGSTIHFYERYEDYD